VMAYRGRQIDGRVGALLDAEQSTILSKRPLDMVAAPSPGAAEEMFLIEGRGQRAARLVSRPSGFELQDEGVQAWFREQFAEALAAVHEPSVEERAPYRGLSPFTACDAPLFFGRERIAEEMVNRLAVQPLLFLVGPSGAGKSSLVQAGIAPALRGEWRVVTVRPGAAPLGALDAGLGAADPPPAGGPLLLVVDQMEEVFTLCQAPEMRQAFARRLIELADGGRARVVVTLRDDFLVRAEALTALTGRIGPALQLLSTPASHDLLRALTEPARRAGYEFEDERLPREMVEAVAELPAALPLLSFTAARLWELRDRHFRQLTRKAYSALGGVGGALARHAEETLSAMSGDEQRLTREVFRNLVTAEGTRAVLTRSELDEILGGAGRSVIERLVAARLLVTSEGDGGRIEITHEALISAWPRLRTWVRDEAEGARLRDQLRSAARQWDERGRPRGLLWRDDALAEYVLWRKRQPARLTEVEESFASASLADAAR